MSKEPVYWTTKDGRELNVDDMDDNHVRNAFKMLIRQHKAVVDHANLIIAKYNTLAVVARGTPFELHGEAAQEFNDSFPESDCDATIVDIEP